MLIFCLFFGLLYAAAFVLRLSLTKRLRDDFLGVRNAGEPPSEFPAATIVVCLRGADPGLRESLVALMRQDYLDYELRIVVDHERDAAWEIAREAVAATGFSRARIEVLKERLPTCSLKCSALVQAVTSLGDSCEIVALADADTRADERWLRRLAAPFADRGVGATFGVRWFRPANAGWGSLVRSLWNAAGVLFAARLSIPWGGAMALRVSALRDAGVVEKWSRSMVDDTSLTGPFERRGWRIEFVPQLVLVNEEECSLRYCLNFITRQLAWIRLYHPAWKRIRQHALLAAALDLGTIGLGTFGATRGRWELVAFAAGCYGARILGMVLSFRNIERGIEAQFPESHIRSWRRPLKTALATPLTELLHLLAVARASVQRRFRWRGVTYRVHGPAKIRRLDYRPYHLQPQPSLRSNHSL